MESGGERRPDVDVGRLARRGVDAHRRMTAVEAGRNNRRERAARHVRELRCRAAEPDLGRVWVDVEAVAADGDASTLDRPERTY
jgi:hypothetical protein